MKYRIAYLGAADSTSWVWSRARSATAPVRTVTSTGPGQPRPAPPTLLGVQERSSHPCRSPAQFQHMCALLDGEGVFGTSVIPGERRDKASRPASSGSPSPRTRGGSSISRLHLHPDVPGSVDAAVALIEASERATSGSAAFYPPLIVGDFNGGPEKFPTFDTLGVAVGPTASTTWWPGGGASTVLVGDASWGWMVALPD